MSYRNKLNIIDTAADDNDNADMESDPYMVSSC